MDYMEIIEKLEKAALHPAKTVMDSIEITGKPAIGCFPVHTPEELIYAAGALPVGMWGGNTELQLADKYLQSFCCSIMRSNMEYAMKGNYNMLCGVLIPTFCDTLKCVCENWKAAIPNIPVVPVVYPQNRKIECGFDYAVDEFKRVRCEIEKILKVTISDSDVEKAFDLYEDYRAVMREFTQVAAMYPETLGARTRHLIIKAGQFMDKAEYKEDVKAIIEGLKNEKIKAFTGIKAIATGLLAEPTELLQIFEENQIAFVGDDLAQESRQWRTPARTDAENVWAKMAYRIADQKGDTFFYEEKKTRGQMLIDMVKEKKADAVIVFMMKFCDPEEFDYPIYKTEIEAAGIPLLYLEIEQQITSFEQLRTRVQSFTEMLV